MAKILLISDTSKHQTNGVVTTMQNVTSILKHQGHEIYWLSPDQGKSFKFPLDKEICIGYISQKQVLDSIKEISPNYVHIVTEGNFGLTARLAVEKMGINFTTSYHTKFPEYLKDRFCIPVMFTKWYFKWFHNKSKCVFVPTQSLCNELENEGWTSKLLKWGRGVNSSIFTNKKRHVLLEYNKPKFLYVGRTSIEKNIKEFLDVKVPGTKTVVGDGPQLQELMSLYPNVRFTGTLKGTALANEYANNDIFVFPSRTDTFGIVLLEALSSGLVVAAQNLEYISEIVTQDVNGVFDKSLQENMLKATQLRKHTTPSEIAKSVENFSWEKIAEEFYTNLVSV